jgi:hypothetical protein
VTRLVLGEAAGAVLAGALIGLTAAVATRALVGPPRGAGSAAAAIVVTVSVTLAGAGLLAAWHPVRRALAVDPREALRAE